MAEKYLPVIRESTKEWEEVEKVIKDLLRREIYLPIIKEFDMTQRSLHNAKPTLADAVRTGQITFNRGTFSGRFNSSLSKELQALGARFDRKTGTWKIGLPSLPVELRNQISASLNKFEAKIAGIDKKLAQILPEDISAKLKVEHLFDKALWKVETDFQRSIRGVSLAPNLTAYQRKRIAAEWSQNLQLYIQDFSKKEILDLRTNMQKSVFAGNRYGSAVKTIEESYGVTANKAKFLARQESSLLMAKFKQTRYQEAGINYYKWGCVSGTKSHPVRAWHKALEGKVFRWDDPPIASEPGKSPVRRCNPKQDYNCRCFARPMVNYRGPYTRG